MTSGGGTRIPPRHRAVWGEDGTLFHEPVEHLGRPAIWPTNTAPIATAYAGFEQSNRLPALLPQPGEIIDLTRGSSPAASLEWPDHELPQVTGLDMSMPGLGVQSIPHGDPHMMLPMAPDKVQTAPGLPVQGRAGVTNSDDDLAAMLLVAIAAEQHYA